jgi:hypothetical protein
MDDGAIDQVPEEVAMVARIMPTSVLTTQDSKLLLEIKKVPTKGSEAVTENPCGPLIDSTPPAKDHPVLADDPALMVKEVEVPSPKETPETGTSTVA